MNLKDYKTWIVVAVLLAGGIIIGRYTLPERVITKTETQVVTKEVTKTVEVDKTDYYKNKVLIETTTTKPDGTVIKQRKFVDKSVVLNDDEKNTTDDKSSTTTTTTQTDTTYNTGYKGSVKIVYAKHLDNLSEDIYGIEVDKKLIGPLVISGLGLTDKTIGLGLGVNF